MGLDGEESGDDVLENERHDFTSLDIKWLYYAMFCHRASQEEDKRRGLTKRNIIRNTLLGRIAPKLIVETVTSAQRA